MDLFAFGINHTTAPVDVRERVGFVPERLPMALQDLVSKDATLSQAGGDNPGTTQSLGRHSHP